MDLKGSSKYEMNLRNRKSYSSVIDERDEYERAFENFSLKIQIRPIGVRVCKSELGFVENLKEERRCSGEDDNILKKVYRRLFRQWFVARRLGFSPPSFFPTGSATTVDAGNHQGAIMSFSCQQSRSCYCFIAAEPPSSTVDVPFSGDDEDHQRDPSLRHNLLSSCLVVGSSVQRPRPSVVAAVTTISRPVADNVVAAAVLPFSATTSHRERWLWACCSVWVCVLCWYGAARASFGRRYEENPTATTVRWWLPL
ncbi:unnamed protein product [Lactuca saligna]|uniref:Uncharacterized protein n=1 Tax=Lactuca saligna TaxID=75948 RepID=A0AA35UK39_LACSI|nr:unnamed protein product [Lactuca saligna]